MKKTLALVLMVTMIMGFVSCGSSEPTTLVGESADKVNKVGPAFSDITIEKQDDTANKPTDTTNQEKPKRDDSLAKTIVFETNMGTFEVSLFAETPIASGNMIDKVKSGFYNGLIFHRVVKGFVVQGGDPTGTGGGGESMALDEKQMSNLNKKGTVSMAAKDISREQSDCQFFINTNNNTSLDSQGFIAFGEVTKGYDVIEKIENLPVDQGSRPTQEVRIIKADVK